MDEPDFHLLNAEALSPVILLAEHAGKAFPQGVDLGFAPDLLEAERNLLFDHGVDGITRALADKLGATAILGNYSRLWIDLNRAEDAPDLIPQLAHGHTIPGNQVLMAQAVEARLVSYRAYHAAVTQQIDRHLAAGVRPLLFSIHSFTPAVGLKQSTEPDRNAPDIGLLYLEERAAVGALRRGLQNEGIVTADNFPYDLRTVSAGGLHIYGGRYELPVMGVEISIDILHSHAGEQAWADRLFKALTPSLM